MLAGEAPKMTLPFGGHTPLNTTRPLSELPSLALLVTWAVLLLSVDPSGTAAAVTAAAGGEDSRLGPRVPACVPPLRNPKGRVSPTAAPARAAEEAVSGADAGTCSRSLQVGGGAAADGCPGISAVEDTGAAPPEEVEDAMVALGNGTWPIGLVGGTALGTRL